MWYELRIENCLPEDVDLLSNFLEEEGSLSLTLTDKNDDPVLEPLPGTTPLWPEVILTALYDDENLAHKTAANLQTDYPHLHYHITVLQNQDWISLGIEGIKPQQFGQRLWVCPDWSSCPDQEAVNLILSPGLAFGTGTHPTTSLCLRWLDTAQLNEKTMIDYGCGSGILALAAIKLGLKKAYAVDIDPQALQATYDNAFTNKIEPSQLITGLPDILSKPVDILIANILLNPLIDLKDVFHSLLKQDSTLVVSGLLETQIDTLQNAYADKFTIEKIQISEEWALVEFRP